MFIYTFGYIKEVIMGYDSNAALTDVQNNDIGFTIGIAFAILNTVGFLLPALVLEPIAEKIGRVRTHTLAIAVSAVGFLLIVYMGQTVTSFFVLMAVVGVDQRKMGLMMGLFNLSVVLPQIVASNLGGYIEHAVDKSLIFWISAGTLGVSALLWLLVKETASTESLRDSPTQ
jgi:maltose/moltooligosaccharide transporter